jgi:hypothetical protein
MKRLALLALPLLSGCFDVSSDEISGLGARRMSSWYETGQVKKPREDLARLVRDLMARQGYNTPDFDEKKEWIETDWDVSLSPRYREGYRTKLQAEILPLGENGYNVRVRSWMEINNASINPSDPARAVWIGAGVSDRHKDRIDEPALKLFSTLRLRLFGLNQ